MYALIVVNHQYIVGKFPRQLNDTTNQIWTDNKMCLYDCQERMKGFRYGFVMDKDEIIIPEGIPLKNSLDVPLVSFFSFRNYADY